MTEGLNLAAPIKAEVSEYFAQNGTWPTALVGVAGTLGHTAAQVPSGKYVSAVNIPAGNNGTIVITYSNAAGFQANRAINGLVLTLRPRLSGAAGGNEDVVWVCGYNVGPTLVHDPAVPSAANATTVLQKHLPANCRI